MTMYLRVFDECGMTHILENFNNEDIRFINETDFIRMMCHSHLENYGYHEVNYEVMAGTFAVNPFLTDDEQAVHLEYFDRLMGFARCAHGNKAKAIGAFSRLWDLCEREGDVI